MSIESKNKNLRNWIGAAALFLIVVGITVSLFFVEIPEKNNDVIKLIIGVLVGSISPVIFSIIGKDPEELEKKNLRIQHLESENVELRRKVDKLEEMFMKLQERVIDKISDLKKQ